jgi:hypothetical protein
MCPAAETEEEVDASLPKALLQSSALAPLPFSHVIDGTHNDENGDGVCCGLGTVPTVTIKKKKRKRTRSRWTPSRRAGAVFARNDLWGDEKKRYDARRTARGGRGGTGSCPEASAAAAALPDDGHDNDNVYDDADLSRGVGSCERRTIRSVCTNVRGSRDGGAGNDAELRSAHGSKRRAPAPPGACVRPCMRPRRALRSLASVSLWIFGS